MRKKILSLIMVTVMAFSLAACGGEEEKQKETEITENKEKETSAEDIEDGSWAVYWYLCGSDLESGGGFATGDLNELMQVKLPKNVKVVIETGGSAVWQNDLVDAGKLQRWLYDSEGLKLIDEQPSASMGESKTLAEFLKYAKTNYPADKTAVIFWNHGGGTVTGAAFDELYENDSLTLTEMYEAFSSVWEPSEDNQPLELIGFDTCLMATVDVANTFSTLAQYMVASEETEPANGWYYSQWLGELAENTDMDGKELGKIICDAYYTGCEEVGTQDNTTLSLTDLSKVADLLKAYETFGAEALAAACENPAFFATLGKVAVQSENYGGNTKEQGYTNMVDLGHMARQSKGVLGSAQDVLDALESCVLYKVGGKYRSEATGLSCYYPYSQDITDFNGYIGVGAGVAFKYLYTYGLTGQLDEAGMEYIAKMDFTSLPEVKNLTTMGWDNKLLDVNEEGSAYLTLGPDAKDVLAGIGFSLYCVDETNGTTMLLGTDNDINADWENGVFYDNFRGVWGSIDGNLVYMELSFEGEDYNIYSVPVLINDEQYNLLVVYDFNDEQWSIMGARHSIDESGMADKELRLLQEGDEITSIWYVDMGNGSFEAYTAATFSVTATTSFSEVKLPDGKYSMIFEMRDALGNYAYSDSVDFECTNGEIITTVYGDEK